MACPHELTEPQERIRDPAHHAIVIDQAGGPEVLTYREVLTPVVKARGLVD